MIFLAIGLWDLWLSGLIVFPVALAITNFASQYFDSFWQWYGGVNVSNFFVWIFPWVLPCLLYFYFYIFLPFVIVVLIHGVCVCVHITCHRTTTKPHFDLETEEESNCIPCKNKCHLPVWLPLPTCILKVL